MTEAAPCTKIFLRNLQLFARTKTDRHGIRIWCNWIILKPHPTALDIELDINDFTDRPNPVLVYDSSGIFIYQNTASYQLLGDLLGTSVSHQASLKEHCLRVINTKHDVCTCTINNNSSVKFGDIETIGYALPETYKRGLYITHLSAPFALGLNWSKTSGGKRQNDSDLLRALRKITDDLLEHKPLEQLLQQTVVALKRLTNASSTFVHLSNHRLGVIELVAFSGVELAPIGQRLKPGTGMAGEVFRTGQATYIHDYSQFPNRLKHLQHIKQAAAIPMIWEGEIIGVLGIMFDQEGESIGEYFDVLHQLANLATIVIQNTRMYNDAIIELQQINMLATSAKQISACDTLPDLFKTVARCLIETIGIEHVEVWRIHDNALESLYGAWTLDTGKIRPIAVSERDKMFYATDKWVKKKILESDSISTLGFISLSHYEVAPDEHGSAFALLEHGKIWGLIKLESKSVHRETRKVNILRSMISHAAVAARLVQMLEVANHRASHDDLTGLANKFTLLEHLERRLKENKSNGTFVCVHYFDLDGFKAVNDTFGHTAGDKLLIGLAQSISSAITDDHLFARLGGDEFAIVSINTDALICIALAEKMLQIVASFSATEIQANVGISIGIATATGDYADAEELIRRADEAMYISKRNGKNQYTIATNSQENTGDFQLKAG